jgi:transglutaminase/protease-like cytokinesis protein 3
MTHDNNIFFIIKTHTVCKSDTVATTYFNSASYQLVKDHIPRKHFEFVEKIDKMIRPARMLQLLQQYCLHYHLQSPSAGSILHLATLI